MTAIYTMILNGKVIAEVSGTEYAYEAWAKLEELARFLCVPAYLVSNDDSEVVAEYDPEDDGVDEPAIVINIAEYDPKEDWNDEPDDIDDDMGFDPYEGCFTWDC